MNKLSLLLLLSVLTLSLTFANDPYEEAMKTQIEAAYKANSKSELQLVLNSLVRIEEASPTHWESNYYMAFVQVQMFHQLESATDKDATIDAALKNLDKASDKDGDESEISALRGYAYMMTLTVDPMARGQKYSPLATGEFQRALSYNPNNPRALALLSGMQLGSARFFNSSTAEACATAKKAIDAFGKQTPSNALSPLWGKMVAENTLKSCK